MSEGGKNKKELENEIDFLTKSLVARQGEKDTIGEELEAATLKNAKLQESLKTSENTREDLEEKIRNMELTAFAASYDSQAEQYLKQQNRWFWYVLGAAGMLVASVLFSIFGPTVFYLTGNWYKQAEFYLLNLIFLTMFVYALKQHAHLGNLGVDYSNRKTLAQSYQHIIEEEDEDPSLADIKTRFLDKIVDVFAQKAVVHEGETWFESLLKALRK